MDDEMRNINVDLLFMDESCSSNFESLEEMEYMMDLDNEIEEACKSRREGCGSRSEGCGSKREGCGSRSEACKSKKEGCCSREADDMYDDEMPDDEIEESVDFDFDDFGF